MLILKIIGFSLVYEDGYLRTKLRGGVDVRFFAALLSGMLGFTSKLQVLGIYTFLGRTVFSGLTEACTGMQTEKPWSKEGWF